MGETITIHALFGKAVLKDIPLNRLHSSHYQPRDIFSKEMLASLSKTVEQLGVLEPLIVRLSTRDKTTFNDPPEMYEIVAGERRFRAAKMASLETVPCLLANYSNEQAAQIALIENTHREALSPIAEAGAMKRLAKEFHYTHDEIGALLGVSRSHVTNYLRLLTLDARIQHWMKQGHLSVGHGKILAGISDDKQYWFAYEALKKEWGVATLDEAIKIHVQQQLENKIDGNTNIKQKNNPSRLSPLQEKLSSSFGHAIKVTLNKNDSGSFRIPFQNKEAMCAILKKLGIDDGTI